MPDFDTLTFAKSGAITTIVLNRPDAANGMNDTLTRELAIAAKLCDTEATKVVTLTGAGRFFSAGGDLKSMAAAPSPAAFV
jgi:2-(1,2-epoxy-1,2-dihydrophenyl)acetyl-CoA isomerase